MPTKRHRGYFATIPDDEPVFIVRGKDATALGTIRFWMVTAKNANVNVDKIAGVREIFDEVNSFQEANRDRVKVPD